MHEPLLLVSSSSSDRPDTSLAVGVQRLRSSRERKAMRATPQIDPLTQGSLNKVYFVSAATLAEATWSSARTRLAAANRYFIVIGPGLDSAVTVQACRDGAFDVLDFRDSPQRWQEALGAAVKAQALWWQLYGGLGAEIDPSQLIGRTPAMTALRLAIDRLGPTNASVLILGESGTGKERVAEALHTAGGRGEFVAFNCAALPAELLEAELFGVAKGAFTGAHADRPGLVEQADGGTLFLDEIGEMAPAVQAKLLRFLETRTARRLGSNQTYHVDLRIVAATNRDLDQAMAAGTFRADLYFRLAEISLPLVPLRERADDVPLLARHFVDLAGTRFGKFFDAIEPDLVLKLQAHAWPGNVRELKNTIDRLVLLHDGPVMRAGWWDPPPAPPSSRTVPSVLASNAPAHHTPPPRGPTLRTRRDRIQRARTLVAEGQLGLAEVAAEVGVHPSTLFRWRQAGQI